MLIKSELIKRMLKPFWHAYLALKQMILPFYLGKLWIISINMGNYIKQRSIKNKYFCDDKLYLVGGLRSKRKDNFIKIISSKIANNIRMIVLKDGCVDTGCSLKVFDKEESS